MIRIKVRFEVELMINITVIFGCILLALRLIG